MEGVVCAGICNKCYIEQPRCPHMKEHERKFNCSNICKVIGKIVDCSKIGQEITGRVKVIGEL